MRAAKQIALTIAVLLVISSSLHAQSHIPWVTNWQDASQLAQRHQRLVLIHFWSNDCAPCAKLERSVFNRPELIRAVVSNYVPLKINVQQNADLARHFEVQQWPTDVIVTAQGAELFRGASPQDPNRYIATLDQVAAHARVGQPVSGSPSTPMAANPIANANMSRSSAFPIGPIAGATNPITQSTVNQPNTAPYLGFTSTPPQASGLGQPRTTTGPAPSRVTNPKASGGQYVSNQFAAAPSPTPPPAQEQQASFTSPGQFQVPAQPHRSFVPPEPTTNQFVANNSSSSGSPPANLGSGPVNPPHDRSLAAAPARPPITDAPQGLQTLAMEGYCCVTLVDQEKWVRGDPQWGVLHRGRTYLFASPEQQRRFLADFDRYAPALSGYDCVKYVDQSALVDGKRAHGVFYRGEIFLFADEDALQQFWNAPQRYLPAVRAEQQRHAMRQ